MTPGSIAGKTALITGASSGLGTEFARQLAAQGCNLVLTARRLERLEALKAEIQAAQSAAVDCMTVDLAEPGAPLELHRQLRDSKRDVDILINNAGSGLHGELRSQSWEELRAMLEVDVMALTCLTRLFAEDMLLRQQGYIVQVASIGAFQPVPNYAVYAAAKSYVLNFGEALHRELQGTGVSCTVLCPGTTRTEFFKVSGHQVNTYQRALMMESAEVARIGIKAMLKRRPCVVAGRLNSLSVLSTRFLPRQLLAVMASRLMR